MGGVGRPTIMQRRCARRAAGVLLFSAVLLLASCVTGLSRSDLAVDYYNLGNAYADLGRDDKALEYYGKAVNLKPDLVRASYNLARIYLKQGKIDAARKILEDLLARDPKNVMVLQTEAYALFLAGEKEKSLTTYRHALELDPLSPDLLYNLSIVEHAIGKLDDAYAHAAKAHTIAPDNTDILLRTAEFAADTGKTGEAIKDYEDYVQQKPDDAAAEASLGDLYAAEHFYDRALKAYDASLNQKQDAAVLFRKARIELTAAEDTAGGLRDLDAALKAGFKEGKAISELVSSPDLQSRDEVMSLLEKYKLVDALNQAKNEPAAGGTASSGGDGQAAPSSGSPAPK